MPARSLLHTRRHQSLAERHSAVRCQFLTLHSKTTQSSRPACRAKPQRTDRLLSSLGYASRADVKSFLKQHIVFEGDTRLERPALKVRASAGYLRGPLVRCSMLSAVPLPSPVTLHSKLGQAWPRHTGLTPPHMRGQRPVLRSDIVGHFLQHTASAHLHADACRQLQHAL